MTTTRLAAIAVLGMLGTAFAQDPVPSLQDLVGARGSSGDTELDERGYTWVRTEEAGDAVYTYYQERENGQCITVRTEEGRFQSIVYAPASDCTPDAPVASLADAPAGSWQTVCGVIVGGETYSYVCTVTDRMEGSRKASTLLRFPDNAVTLNWKEGRDVELVFEGMVPKMATFATAEGETNWVFEDKTYFYISDKGRAAWEVEHFQPQ